MSTIWFDVPRRGEVQARALIDKLTNARVLIAEGRGTDAVSEVSAVITRIEAAMALQRHRQIAVEPSP